MHGYFHNCAFMHNFTPTDVDVFLIKMCKISTFSILHNFASIDAIALSQFGKL